MSVNREKKNILVKICHLRGEMLWISRYRSNSTRPSSWSLQFNHFCVNLKTTGKCTKISINHVIIAHFNEMYSLRVKVQTSFVLCTPQFNSQVQTLTSLICDWWILLHVVPGSNLKSNSQMSCELVSAHVIERCSNSDFVHILLFDLLFYPRYLKANI